MRKIYKIGSAFVSLCFTAGIAGGLWYMHESYSEEQAKVVELKKQLAILTEKEKESAVMQSVNAQLEEIANQQRIISDEQREEAEEQSRIANDMRQHAEQERQNALEAEKRAVSASKVAQEERVIAENQRMQAEHSKRVADTLSYIAMARNVGNAAITQQRSGNKELASLLAYASYIYTVRYKADPYHPSIYEALMLTSGGQRKWAVAHGSIIKTTIIPGTTNFISISTYGEILRHTRTRDNLQTKTVFSDNSFDMRDIYFNKERTFYAVSHTGHLIACKENGKPHIISIEGAVRPYRIFILKPNELIITAEQSIHVIDATTLRPIKTLPLNFKTAIAGWKDGRIVVFDQQTGDMYEVNQEITKVTKCYLPFKGRVMSFNANTRMKEQIFGMYDGTVNVLTNDGKVRKLIGHRSRVSRVNYDNNRIYSSSYDGTVRYWNLENDKMEPITILNSRQWIVSLSFDKSRHYIWTGDQNGNLTETLIDIPDMAARLKAKIKRNLTREEWNYYIGKNIPYETFIGKEAKL